MSSQNKQLARRFVEAFAGGDTETLSEIVVADVVDHNLVPGQRPGIEGLLDAVAMFRTAFPDLGMSVDFQVAEGDLVSHGGEITGTNQGELMGMPATGKAVRIAWSDTYRIADGKIIEVWHIEDVAGMLQQLGHVPG